jgi:hypothetical protein
MPPPPKVKEFEDRASLPAFRFDSGKSVYYEANKNVKELVICVGRPVLEGHTQGCPYTIAAIREGGVGNVFDLKAITVQTYTEPKEVLMARVMRLATKSFLKLRTERPATSGDYSESERSDHWFLGGGRKSEVVETPRSFYAALDALFHFDFDPCPVYPVHDAMEIPWGRMNFVNPPFSRADAFVFRAIEQAKQNGATTIVLCPAATNSRWFGLAADTGHLKWVAFLRCGMCFEGFDRHIPNRLMLLCISPEKTARIRGMFIDPLEASKRRVKSCASKTGVANLVQLIK